MFAQSLNLSINAIYDCSFQYRSNILLKIGSCYFFLECICPVVILFGIDFLYFLILSYICFMQITNRLNIFQFQNNEHSNYESCFSCQIILYSIFFSLKLEQAPFSAYTIKLYYFISFMIYLRGFLILDILILMNESKDL